MITYITQATYGAIAEDLDTARIGKQMTECMAIFDKLTGVALSDDVPLPDNHPVLRMWEGFEFALGVYAMRMNLEWTFRRGIADTKAFKFFEKAMLAMKKDDPSFVYEEPPWLGDHALIKSHRSNLKRRDPGTYKNKWKVCPTNWPYIWPVIDESTQGYNLYVSRADKKLLAAGKRAWPDDATFGRIVNL